MAIRWFKNVLIDGKKSTLEIQLGDRFVGDKAYTRINKDTENWFKNKSDDRGQITMQGLEILRKKLQGKKVTLPDGKPYGWTK